MKIKTERKIEFKLIINKYSDIEKGHVTEIWNRLFRVAYDDNNEYFYQCGDDIDFPNKGIKWLDLCIKQLELNNNIGLASPVCYPNKKILTQELIDKRVELNKEIQIRDIPQIDAKISFRDDNIK